MIGNVPTGKNAKYVPASATSYVINSDDDYIFLNTSSTAITVYLPNIRGAGLDYKGKTFYITDLAGTSGANNITVVPSGNNTVNGGSSVILAVAFGSLECKPNGFTDYSIEGPVNNTSTGQSTGSAVNFKTETIYGTPTSPVTGNITASLVDAQLGQTILIIHNAASEPTYPATFKKNSLSGDYSANVNNYIWVNYVSADVQVYSVSQVS